MKKKIVKSCVIILYEISVDCQSTSSARKKIRTWISLPILLLLAILNLKRIAYMYTIYLLLLSNFLVLIAWTSWSSGRFIMSLISPMNLSISLVSFWKLSCNSANSFWYFSDNFFKIFLFNSWFIIEIFSYQFVRKMIYWTINLFLQFVCESILTRSR